MTESPQLKDHKASLRRQLKRARLQLSRQQQQEAEKAIAKRFNQSHFRFNTKSMAVYQAFAGEISPQRITQAGMGMRRHYFLPVLHPVYKNKLVFCRLSKQTRLVPNRFGIMEPEFAHAKKRNPRFISLVLTPLVGFDKRANRLGMGGGFYDRSFEFLNSWRNFSGIPRQIGLAHQCQKVESIPNEAWDISLDGVISDKEAIYSGRK